ERCWRWCRRNPAVASLLAAVALSLVLGTVVAWAFALRADAHAREATEEREKVAAAELEGRRKLMGAYLGEARANRFAPRRAARPAPGRRHRPALGPAGAGGGRGQARPRARRAGGALRRDAPRRHLGAGHAGLVAAAAGRHPGQLRRLRHQRRPDARAAL